MYSNRRPSNIHKNLLDTIYINEKNDDIIIKKDNDFEISKYFTNLIDLSKNIKHFTIIDNIINYVDDEWDKISSNKLSSLYMGREYTFKIKYEGSISNKFIFLSINEITDSIGKIDKSIFGYIYQILKVIPIVKPMKI